MTRLASTWTRGWGRRIILAGLLIIMSAPQAHATNISDDLDAIVSRYEKWTKFNGNVLVAKQGVILLRKSYGVADLTTGRQNDIQNRFSLASITKPLTATMIMQQVELGRLSVDDPISLYVPNTPAPWRDIRVKHLLSHTSGLMDFLNTSILEDIRHLPLEPSEIVDRFRNAPLLFTPGTQVSYSNGGFTLLGMILEKVAGKPYSQLIHENLFGRAGMLGSGMIGENEPDFSSDTFSVGYRLRSNGDWYIPETIHPKILFGLASVFSTVDDLYTFDQALNDGTLVSAETRNLMFTPNLGRTGYGFSYRVVNGHRLVFHEGHIEGFSNRLTRYLDDGVTVILLGNLRDSTVTELSAELAERAFKN